MKRPARDSNRRPQRLEARTKKYNIILAFTFCHIYIYIFFLIWKPGKDAAKLKQWQEEKNQEDMVKNWKKEKEEAKLAKQRVKEQIARDRWVKQRNKFTVCTSGVAIRRIVD